MTDFFHSYDLRGKYPRQISEKEAERVGKAYGTYVEAGEVAVARDARKHAETISDAFKKGVKSTGTDIIDLGVLPSPAMYMYLYKNDLKGGVVVTASHNPEEYIGFKFSKENALSMSREGGMKRIEEIYQSKNFTEGEGVEKQKNIKQEYQDFLSKFVKKEKKLKIAVNYGNGVVSEYSGIFNDLGHEEKSINNQITGGFPNHLPDPGADEAQKALSREMDAETDLGIIFDGDGDRAGFILPEYGYIPEDELIALLSSEILNEKKGKVLYDLRGSKLVPEQIENHGGIPEQTRVGHTFISEQIYQDQDIVFAGELSGHYYYPGIGVPWDDGLLTAIIVSNIASREDLTEILDSFSKYPVSPELRIDCPHAAKSGVIDSIKEEYSDYDLTTKDGVKIGFENGWALIRPSNTEEKMSVRCEADTEEELNKILKRVEGSVRNAIKENSN